MGNPVPPGESTGFQATHGLNLSDVGGLLAANVSGSLFGVISGDTAILNSGAIIPTLSGTTINLQSGMTVPIISGNLINISGLIFNIGSGNSMILNSGLTAQVMSGLGLSVQSGAAAGTMNISGIAVMGGSASFASTIMVSGVATFRTDIVVPTNKYTSPVSGSTYFDTSGFNSFYVNNGASGYIMATRRAPYDFIIHQPITTQFLSSQTKLINAHKWDGVLVASGTDVGLVVQTVFDAVQTGSHIYIADGTYFPPNSFSGLTLGNLTSNNRFVDLEFAQNSRFLMPNLFSGIFLKIMDSCNNLHIHGGRIEENGTAERLWTAIQLNSYTQSGVQRVLCERMFIGDARIGIELLQSSGSGNQGYVAVNTFKDIRFDITQVGVLFNQAEPLVSGQNGINRNIFQNVIWEAANASGMSGGFIDIVGRANRFDNCLAYDLPRSGQSSTVIASGATDTEIIGGIMTLQNFIDKGWHTKIISEPMRGYNDVVTKPSQIQYGAIRSAGVTPTGEGMFAGALIISGANKILDGDGNYYRYTTFGSGGTAGVITSVAVSRRDMKPYLRSEIRMDDVSGMIMFNGFASVAGVFLSGGNALSGQDGIAFYADASSPNFKVIYNNPPGGGATSTIIDTGIPIESGRWNIMELKVEDYFAIANHRAWQWSINNSGWVWVSGDYARSGINMGLQWAVQSVGISGSISMRYGQIRQEH